MLRPTGGTGVQTHCNQLLRSLRAEKLPVELLTPFSAGGFVRNVVFAARWALKPWSGPANVAWYRYWHRVFLERALRRRLAGGDPLTVYCQCPVSAFAALRARRSASQRVVLAIHFCGSQAQEWAAKGTLSPKSHVFRHIRELEADVVKRLDGIVFVSTAARDEFWATPPSSVPVAVIANFLKDDDDATQAEPREPVRDLVSIGSLEPRKNQSFLLDVLSVAREQGHRYTLDLIGEGRDRKELQQKASALGLSDQVRFLGYLPDAAHRIKDYRLYVHPARQEPFGLVLLEAMAAGVPVVAAPVGGVPGIFRDGVEGHFWDIDDPATAATLVADLLDHPLRRARLGELGRQRYLSNFEAAILVPALHCFLMAPGRPVRPGGRALLPTGSDSE